MISASRLPIVLVHGCGGSPASTFPAAQWAERLSAGGRQVLTATLPGHSQGDSADPAQYASLADSLLSGLPARFDAVGYSLGGKLLLDIAQREPGRVGTLVIGGVGDNLFAPERAGPLSAQALEAGIDDSTPPPIAQFYRTVIASGAPLKSVAAVLRRPPNPIFDESSLNQVTAPILVISGTVDPIAKVYERLAAALPTASFVQLPGVDHFGLPAASGFAEQAVAYLLSEPNKPGQTQSTGR
jgi:pimeloyl-ACP methyl ester carboxylesterase